MSYMLNENLETFDKLFGNLYSYFDYIQLDLTIMIYHAVVQKTTNLNGTP